MIHFSSLQAKFVLPVIVSLLFVITAILAKDVEASTLTSDLQALVAQGSDINTQMSTITLNTDNSCTELGSAVASVAAFTAAIDAVSGNLTAPLSVDTDSLTALDDLSTVSTTIASVLAVLSGDISAMSLNSELADIQSALDAMLELSDDIGTMADRILEMGDKI